MADLNERPNRRSIRLRDYDYSTPAAYYITICSHDRRCIFGEIEDGQLLPSRYGQIALAIWAGLPQRWPPVQLDRYVLMPNHLHVILLFPDAARTLPSLGTVVNWYKRAVTVEVRRTEPTLTLWQRGYYDHVVRDERDMDRIREYIELNPGRWEDDEYYRR